MFRKLATALVFLVAITVPSIADAAFNPKLVAETEKGVVLVRTLVPSTTADGKDQRQSYKIGAGFFIDTNLIITNDHVVAGPDNRKVQIEVQDSNITFDAEVVAEDAVSDIALLKLVDWNEFSTENEWKVLSFASSLTAQAGQFVWAIGHPSGFAWTISVGVLSNTYRALSDNPPYELQSDISIFPGNSGGPLLDENGYVLGINNQILAVPGGEMSFSIPSDLLKKEISNLLQDGKVTWPWLGLLMTDNKAGSGRGVQVVDIATEGSAFNSTLKAGDLIIAISTRLTEKPIPVLDTSTIYQYLRVLNKGDVVKLTVMRDKEKLVVEIPITVVKASSTYPQPNFDGPPAPPANIVPAP
jgi:S1-C subfamily serine protease